MSIPDFFIAGPPKAGTTALHVALANHPDLFMSTVKEPKYFLCADQPPANQAGPGDAHSAQEWVWRRQEYEALFAAAPEGALRGESTPFYLSDVGAQARIRMERPEAKFVIVLRDPIDRAHSNWAHLWADGLEPVSDFVSACRAEEERREAGWAPFWRYLGLGKYGTQLRGLQALFPADQIHWLRYRQLVDDPVSALEGICGFLGVDPGVIDDVPPANVSTYVQPSWRSQMLQNAVRAGASVGRRFPPQLWRKASVPLLRALKDQPRNRPSLYPEQRLALVPEFEQDVALLAELTGERYSDWLSAEGKGAYSLRRA